MRVLGLSVATVAVLFVCLATAAALFPPVTVEVGLGSGASTSEPAEGASKSINGTDREKMRHSKRKTASWAMVRTQFTPPPAAAITNEPAIKAEVGLEYADLIERCGSPSIEITAEDGLKKLNYGSTRVLVREGMVTAVVVPNVRK